MILKEGSKILVAHRRLFLRDVPRFFVGRVDAYEDGIVKATGHSFARDVLSGNIIEKAEPRTKLLSLASGTLIVYQLPDNVLLESLQFVVEDRRLSITDGADFTMNLAEFTHAGKM